MAKKRPSSKQDSPPAVPSTDNIPPAPAAKTPATRPATRKPRKPASTDTVPPPKPRKAPAPRKPRAPVEPLSIVFVSPEAHPFAKTGGLAEVAAALPAALAALGHRVTLVIPRYRGIDTTGSTPLPLSFRLGDQDLTLAVFERSLPDGVTLALVDAPALFDREGLYGDPTRLSAGEGSALSRSLSIE